VGFDGLIDDTGESNACALEDVNGRRGTSGESRGSNRDVVVLGKHDGGL